MANEIDRDYVCPDENCNRSYGAETSLLQHIKLKHSEFYHSKQCEDFVRSLPKKANGEYKM